MRKDDSRRSRKAVEQPFQGFVSKREASKVEAKETHGIGVPFWCDKCKRGPLVLTSRGGTRIGTCGCAWTIWEIDEHDRVTRWKPLKGQV